ncbi:MAG: polyprenyl synthetase family protein [Bacteroidetes bacterium]|nr:polyprenyl synthetase family protein [Bacteroidota bacterium]
MENYLRLIDEALLQPQFPGEPRSLYYPAEYMMSLGGKRIRPVLVLMGCDLFGGDISKALQPALAVEVFHNFSLVHDDLMDNAALRRGKETVHTRWGRDIAILSGDVMLVHAYELLAKAEGKVLPQILSVFNELAKRVCEGQQLDMDFQQRNDVTEKDYLKMIGLKTAALLGGSFKIGALIAEANPEDAAKIYDFGYGLGTAFQLHDDILDTFGDEETFGKKIGGDIIENKKTYLTIKALEVGTAEQVTELEHLYNLINPLPPEEKIKRVKKVFEELNIANLALQKRDEIYNNSIQKLESIAATTEKKNILLAFAEGLMQRVK